MKGEMNAIEPTSLTQFYQQKLFSFLKIYVVHDFGKLNTFDNDPRPQPLKTINMKEMFPS